MHKKPMQYIKDYKQVLDRNLADRHTSLLERVLRP